MHGQKKMNLNNMKLHFFHMKKPYLNVIMKNVVVNLNLKYGRFHLTINGAHVAMVISFAGKLYVFLAIINHLHHFKTETE